MFLLPKGKIAVSNGIDIDAKKTLYLLKKNWLKGVIFQKNVIP